MVSTFQFVVGVIGNVISMGLFLSTVPTFWRIVKTKTTGNYSPVPYVATILNCALWVFYGSPLVNYGILVMTINGAGFCFQIIYLLLFLIYAKNKKTRRVVSGMIVAVVAFFVIVVLINMLAFSKKKKREIVVGVLCVIFNSSMYLSPLAIIKTVITTRSTEFMPLALSIFNLLNGCVWTLYAILGVDVYMMIPNGLGVVFAIGQLILYGCYCGNSKLPAETPNEPETTDTAIDVKVVEVSRQDNPV